MTSDIAPYGVGDASYQAAGRLAGLSKLVNAFYDHMEALPEAKQIRDMHKADLTESRTKLAYFLSGWLGGPKLYSQHFGSISIPPAHRHLAIAQNEVDAWLLCMQKAVDEQSYDESFKLYLMTQLAVPAERIRIACSR